MKMPDHMHDDLPTLRKRFSALYAIATAKEAHVADLQRTLDELRAATNPEILASERQANAILTEENAALTARVAELEAMQEWRPISTAPRHDGDVQLYCEDTGEQFVGWRHDETRWQYAADKISGTVTVCRPSHWKPLTPAPTKDKKAECPECQGTGRTAYGYEDCPSCK